MFSAGRLEAAGWLDISRTCHVQDLLCGAVALRLFLVCISGVVDIFYCTMASAGDVESEVSCTEQRWEYCPACSKSWRFQDSIHRTAVASTYVSQCQSNLAGSVTSLKNDPRIPFHPQRVDEGSGRGEQWGEVAGDQDGGRMWFSQISLDCRWTGLHWLLDQDRSLLCEVATSIWKTLLKYAKRNLSIKHAVHVWH